MLLPGILAEHLECSVGAAEVVSLTLVLLRLCSWLFFHEERSSVAFHQEVKAAAQLLPFVLLPKYTQLLTSGCIWSREPFRADHPMREGRRGRQAKRSLQSPKPSWDCCRIAVALLKTHCPGTATRPTCARALGGSSAAPQCCSSAAGG